LGPEGSGEEFEYCGDGWHKAKKDVELGDGGKRRGNGETEEKVVYGLFNKPDCVGTALHYLYLQCAPKIYDLHGFGRMIVEQQKQGYV
jgi:hypothetical protein